MNDKSSILGVRQIVLHFASLLLCNLHAQADEREEVDLMSGDETEETDLDAEDLDEEEREAERTSAAVIAEEGRGLIMRGEGVATVHLHVQPGSSAPLRSILLASCSSHDREQVFLVIYSSCMIQADHSFTPFETIEPIRPITL